MSSAWHKIIFEYIIDQRSSILSDTSRLFNEWSQRIGIQSFKEIIDWMVILKIMQIYIEIGHYVKSFIFARHTLQHRI